MTRNEPDIFPFYIQRSRVQSQCKHHSSLFECLRNNYNSFHVSKRSNLSPVLSDSRPIWLQECRGQNWAEHYQNYFTMERTGMTRRALLEYLIGTSRLYLNENESKSKRIQSREKYCFDKMIK